jgi:hypothetical protein
MGLVVVVQQMPMEPQIRLCLGLRLVKVVQGSNAKKWGDTFKNALGPRT